MLLEKIKEYLFSMWYVPKDIETIAKDICNIVEDVRKEHSIPDCDNCDIGKENTKLKNKLINYNPTKQLELEEEITELKESLENAYGIRDEAITNMIKMKKKISRLEANEKIYHERLKDNRDKIIEVLCQYNIYKYNPESEYTETLMSIKQIADEILKGE